MIRKVVALLVVFATMAMVGPWVAPYAADTSHRDFTHAPPMMPRIVHDGAMHAPFAYPVVLADRLKQQYVEDRSRLLPLPWFAATPHPPVFLFGADSYGRDVFSRVLHGARVSISLALIATLCSLLVGTLLGGIAGYRGGPTDEIIMRFADLISVLPVIYLVLVLRAALPLVLAPSIVFVAMTAIFAIVGWPFIARGVRSIIASERDREYILAARALGASNARIMYRHLFPACAGYLVVQSTVLFPAFIVAEATLSFVGLGFPESMASWGTMLMDAANVTTIARFPWTLLPAAAIFFVVLSANAILQSSKISRQPSVVSLQSPVSRRQNPVEVAN